MSNQDIDLVVTDLRLDGTRWDTSSTAFADAMKIVTGGGTLPYATFDGITHALGATSSYNETHELLRTLLAGGVAETARIAEALRQTATNMEAADDAASG